MYPFAQFSYCITKHCPSHDPIVRSSAQFHTTMSVKSEADDNFVTAMESAERAHAQLLQQYWAGSTNTTSAPDSRVPYGIHILHGSLAVFLLVIM